MSSHCSMQPGFCMTWTGPLSPMIAATVWIGVNQRNALKLADFGFAPGDTSSRIMD